MNVELNVARLAAAAGVCLASTVPGAHGACIDVVDEAAELPRRVSTPARVELEYVYDLAAETYTVRVAGPGAGAGPFGPFFLTRGCMPAALEWESADYVLLQAGCGTFCWYVLVLPVTGTEARRVERPLAFDAARNLLATYHAQDLIRVSSLITGATHDIPTKYACPSSQGPCFENPTFAGNTFSYTWWDGTLRETVTTDLAL